MLKTRTQRWWAATAVAGVLILAATWFLLVDPSRTKASDLRMQAEAAQNDVQVQQTKVAQLKSQFADLAKKKAQLSTIRSQMPSSAQMPQLVKDVSGYASSSGVQLLGLTPGTPTVSTATGGTAASASTSQPVLVEIPLSLQTNGDFFESSLFLKSLQTTMTRSFFVSGIQLAAGASSGSGTPDPTAADTADPTATNISMTLTGKVYVLLDGTTTLADVKKETSKLAQSS
ncbi:type 4a pilus biogenesis protein PilO [Spongisporangium articulatum]|uniref:Type 4a pilus biogenesis protein PilO n=1 Tax=Spongisporangium articulatum TaxID=3362603 RepID=A0ABW8ASF4_9ACTN